MSRPPSPKATWRTPGARPRHASTATGSYTCAHGRIEGRGRDPIDGRVLDGGGRRTRPVIATSRRAARADEDRWTSSRDADRKSTRLNSSHQIISYAVFCLKKKTNQGVTDRRSLGTRVS